MLTKSGSIRPFLLSLHRVEALLFTAKYNVSHMFSFVAVVQLLSQVKLFATRPASLSFIISQSFLRLMSI